MNPKLTNYQRRSVAISTVAFVIITMLILIFMRWSKEPLKSRLPLIRLDLHQRTSVAFEPVTTAEIPQLLEALGSWDMDVRYVAAFRLGRLGAPAVEPLIPRLGDSDPQMRRWVGITLGMIGSPATNALGSLAGLLRDDHADVRVAAAYALARVGPAAGAVYSQILEATKSQKLPLPMGASFFINHKRVPGGQICTLGISGYHWFGRQRQKAQRGTGGIVDLRLDWKSFIQSDVELNAQRVHEVLGDAPVPPLMEVLTGADDEFRNLAANTLARIGKPAVKRLIAALQDARLTVRKHAAFALGMIGADAREAIPGLIAMLESEKPSRDGHCDGCGAATFALQHVGTESISPLLTLLGSDNPTISLYSAAALGEIKPKAEGNLDLLIRALTNDRRHVRASAALVLGEIGPSAQRAVPTLEAILAGNEPQDSINAAWSLERIEPNSGRGVTALIQLLKEENSETRLAAANALEGLGPIAAKAASALVQASDDPDNRVRLAAITALGAIHVPSEEVIEALFRALKGPTQNRNRTALVLGSLGQSAMPALLRSLKDDQDPEVRRWAAFGLAQMRDGEAAIPGLVAALEDEMGFVRVEAAQALGRIGQTQLNHMGVRPRSPAADAVPGLVRLLKDASSSVRSAAAHALGQIGESGPEIVAALKARIRDESGEVRREAVFSLESLGLYPKEAIAVLEEVIQSPKAHQWDRSRAVRLLAKMKSEGAR